MYLIKVSRKNIYKIGKSDDPLGRLQGLQTANPHKLRVVHTFKADNASAAEESLHALFHQQRMEGEWFTLTPAEVERLSEIERYETELFWINGHGMVADQLFHAGRDAPASARSREGFTRNNDTHMAITNAIEELNIPDVAQLFAEWLQHSPHIQKTLHWKGVTILMKLEGIQMTVTEMTLDDLVWLRDHHAKHAELYQPTIRMTKQGVITDLQFGAAIQFKTWTPESMQCVNDILAKLMTEES